MGKVRSAVVFVNGTPRSVANRVISALWSQKQTARFLALPPKASHSSPGAAEVAPTNKQLSYWTQFAIRDIIGAWFNAG